MRKRILLFCVVSCVMGLILDGLEAKLKTGPLSGEVTVRPSEIKAAQKPRVKVEADFYKIPLYFIENRGQVNEQARFYAKTPGYTLWLTTEGLLFDSLKPGAQKKAAPGPGSRFDRRQQTRYQRDVSGLFFIGANKQSEMIAIEPAALKVNYFIGSDRAKWCSDIPTSAAVLYQELYRNIDLKVYGLEKQIEYDWIIGPGGRTQDIRFTYRNVKSTRVDREGNLVIRTRFGNLVHKKPVGYQQAGDEGETVKQMVDVRFKKMGQDTFGFVVGKYDKTRPLFIDPLVLSYSTCLGGDDSDMGFSIAVEAGGYVYVTGWTNSADFPVLGEYQAYQGEIDDVFISKIDTALGGAASLVYSTYLGGTHDDYGYGIAVDGNGCAYVTGETLSPDFPLKNEYQACPGNGDAFVARIDTTRSGTDSLIYSSYLGGSWGDWGGGIAAHGGGLAYITGYTSSTDFPVLGNFQDYNGGDAFITQIDTGKSGADSLLYSTFLGGGNTDIGYGLAVDTSGYIYVAGRTTSPNFPVQNYYQTHQGLYDAFLTKIDPNQEGDSAILYSTYLGGEDYEECYALAVDGSGCAFLTGYTESTDFPIHNEYQSAQGGRDAFVARIDTQRSGDQSLVYSTVLGGTDMDEGTGIAVDGSGYAYVTGTAYSADFPAKNQLHAFHGGRPDIFIGKIDTARSGEDSLVFSTPLGGSSEDQGGGIAVDGAGHVYVTGSTISPDFPLVKPYQTYHGDEEADVIISKLHFSEIIVTSPNGGEVLTAGSVHVIKWTTQGDIESVGIDYSPDNGNTWITIVEVAENDGLFPWTVPNNPSANCLVRIRVIGLDDGPADVSDNVFSILPSEVASITVISPNGGENLVGGSIWPVTWTFGGSFDQVTIHYTADRGLTWTPVARDIPNNGSYSWLVPDTPAGTCWVRIAGGDRDGGPVDMSDSAFSITSPVFPRLRVLFPNGGESLVAGSYASITWGSAGAIDSIKIDYSTDNGGSWSTVIESTANTGSYGWLVPSSLSAFCLVRVSATSGDPSDVGDAVFSIVSPPSLTLVSPNGGETWPVDTVQAIIWSSGGYVGEVRIEYSVDNGAGWLEISPGTENDGTFNWTVPHTPSSTCLIRISGVDSDWSPEDVSDAPFTIGI